MFLAAGIYKIVINLTIIALNVINSLADSNRRTESVNYTFWSKLGAKNRTEQAFLLSERVRIQSNCLPSAYKLCLCAFYIENFVFAPTSRSQLPRTLSAPTYDSSASIFPVSKYYSSSERLNILAGNGFRMQLIVLRLICVTFAVWLDIKFAQNNLDTRQIYSLKYAYVLSVCFSIGISQCSCSDWPVKNLTEY